MGARVGFCFLALLGPSGPPQWEEGRVSQAAAASGSWTRAPASPHASRQEGGDLLPVKGPKKLLTGLLVE